MHKTRGNKESGDRMESTGRIGGDFAITPSPSYLESRAAVFDRLWGAHIQEIASLPEKTISIHLPDGNVKEGIAHKTSPLDVAKEISQGLADSVVIARVKFLNAQVADDGIVACDEEEGTDAADLGTDVSEGELWDLNRPLTNDCQLKLLKFEDGEAKTVCRPKF